MRRYVAPTRLAKLCARVVFPVPGKPLNAMSMEHAVAFNDDGHSSGVVPFAYASEPPCSPNSRRKTRTACRRLSPRASLKHLGHFTLIFAPPICEGAVPRPAPLIPQPPNWPVIWACRARIRAVHASILSNILSQRSTCLSHTFPPVPHRRRQQFSTPLLLVRAVSVTFPTDIRGTNVPEPGNDRLLHGPQVREIEVGRLRNELRSTFGDRPQTRDATLAPLLFANEGGGSAWADVT